MTEAVDQQPQPLSLPARFSLSVVWVVLAAWLQLARLTGTARPWDSLWAEDGGVFLTNAYQRGLSGNLFRSHAGYEQVIARLVTQPAALLPLSWGAAWMAWSAAVVVGACSLIVWNRAGALTRHLGARIALTLLVPFLPQVGTEVSGAVNDLHWYLIYTLFWVLIAAPRSVPGGIAAAAFAVLVGLSDPLSALMLVAAAAGWWISGRNLRAVMAPAALVAALVVQFLVAAATHTSTASVGDIPQIYALRVVLSAFTGDHLLASIYPSAGMVPAIVACAAMISVVVVLVRRSASPAILVAVAAVILSGGFLATALSTRGTVGFLVRHPFTVNGSRYTVVPLWLLFTALIVLADHWHPPPGRTARRTLVGVPVALIVVGSWLASEALSDWSEPTIRAAAPSWRHQVRDARNECLRPVGKRDRTLPGVYEGPLKPDDIVIPIDPLPGYGHPPLFGVIVSCHRVLR